MITSKLKCLAALMLLFLSASVFATSCLPGKVSSRDRMYWLNNEGGKAVYFIKNTSSADIILDHPTSKNPGAKAGWSSTLHPQKWSALLVSRPNFALSCAKAHGDKMVNVVCNKSTEICKSNVTNITQEGDFWLVEDKSWGEMVSGVQTRLKQ